MCIRDSGEVTKPGADVFIRRMQSVMVARSYVLIDYDIRTELLADAIAVTPGYESPTVSQLNDPAWSAVRSMVEKKDSHKIMDRLYSAGARAILVTAIDACRM